MLFQALHLQENDMNQAETFENLYYKTLEFTGNINYVLLLMVESAHTSKVDNGLKELRDSIYYVEQLLQNRMRTKTKLSCFIHYLEQAVANNFCNINYRGKILPLVSNNNIANLLKDLIEKCNSIKISIDLIEKAYKNKDHYHLVLEFEEECLKFCAFIKILHVAIYLSETESKPKTVTKQKLFLLTRKTDVQQKK